MLAHATSNPSHSTSANSHHHQHQHPLHHPAIAPVRAQSPAFVKPQQPSTSKVPATPSSPPSSYSPVNGSSAVTPGGGGSGYSPPPPSHFTPLIERSFQGDQRMLNLAHSIINSSWFQAGNMEPPVSTTDDIVKEKIVRPGESRFRAFLEMTPVRTYRCQFVTEQGRCGRTEERLDRAQGHARQHLEYRPFVCGGKCARSDCTQRFFSSGQKDDHIRRSIPRRKQCDQCGKQISIQNVSRHMKVIHPESVTPSTGDMKPPPARGYQPY